MLIQPGSSGSTSRGHDTCSMKHICKLLFTFSSVYCNVLLFCSTCRAMLWAKPSYPLTNLVYLRRLKLLSVTFLKFTMLRCHIPRKYGFYSGKPGYKVSSRVIVTHRSFLAGVRLVYLEVAFLLTRDECRLYGSALKLCCDLLKTWES